VEDTLSGAARLPQRLSRSREPRDPTRQFFHLIPSMFSFSNLAAHADICVSVLRPAYAAGDGSVAMLRSMLPNRIRPDYFAEEPGLVDWG
jgi:hypothetical protein